MDREPSDSSDEAEAPDSASTGDALDAWLADDKVVALQDDEVDVQLDSAEEARADVAGNPWLHLDPLSSWLLRIALALIIVVLATTAAMVIFFMTVEKAPRTAVERDIAAAEIAVRARPSDASAWQTLGYAFARAQRYDDALAVVRKGRSATKEQFLLLPEAEVLRTAGRFKESVGVYDEALVVLSKEESEAVAARKKQGIAMSAPNASLVSAYYGRGLALKALGDTRGAIKDVSAALSLDPGQATMRVTLGDLYAASGDTARAKAAYTEALRYVPDYEEAKLGLRRIEEGE